MEDSSAAKKPRTTQELLEKLADRFPPPAYAFLSQVADGTGMNRCRTADALITSLWPSRGLSIMGCELKVSRSDWLHELKQPEKADSIGAYCNQWYVVVSDAAIVQTGELPQAWGLIAPSGKGGALKVTKEAPYREIAKLDLEFVVAVMRNVCERMVAKDLIKTQLAEAEKRGEENADWEGERARKNLGELQEKMVEFEKYSCVNILNVWAHPIKDIGTAVKKVLEGRADEALKQLQDLKVRAENIAKFCEGELSRHSI